MKLKPYSTYKESGVEWLGKVPEGWKISPLKHHFKIIGGSTPKSDNEEYWDGEIIWVTPSDLSKLSSFYINDSQRKITPAGLGSCGSTLVPAGSIILSTRAPIGSVALAKEKICTNQGCKSLVPDVQTNSKFYAYLLSINSVELNARGKGTTFLELSGDELSALKVGFPSPQEQSAIVIFLDRETAKMDTLIAKQENLIELLREKRQAIISHAVTKGLNPDAKMKDSGVEWLGMVPDEWIIKPLKHVSSVNDDVISESTNPETEIEYVDIGSVSVENGIEKSELMKFFDAPSRARRRVLDGDIIVSTVRTYLKAIAPIIKPPSNLVCSTGFAVIRPRKDLIPAYAKYFMQSGYFIDEVIARSVGVSYPAINSSEMICIRMPLPSREDQMIIAAYLDDQTSRIDTLIDKARRSIELAKEHRTALISAAVTGKIDVREVA